MAHTNHKTLGNDIKTKQMCILYTALFQVRTRDGRQASFGCGDFALCIAIVVSVRPGCTTQWFVDHHIALCLRSKDMFTCAEERSHNHGRTIPFFIRKEK